MGGASPVEPSGPGGSRMKRSNTFLKWAAVASSILLAGGFIAHQAGAFDWFKKASPQPEETQSVTTDTVHLGGSKYKVIFVDPGADSTATDPKLMWSSKSSPIFVPDRPAAPDKPAAQPSP